MFDLLRRCGHAHREHRWGKCADIWAQPNGAWSDEATTTVKPDYTLTTSGGTSVGATRNFSLVYDKGMKSFAPASGTQYWYFSVNGVMQPAITNPLSISNTVAPGATINGSYTITQGGANNVVFEKMIFDATAGVRVVCNGQSGNTVALNPHTTPVATNVSDSFTAFAVANASITSISHQNVTTHARVGDVISFAASGFSAANASATAQLCDAAGANCSAAPAQNSTFAVAANGTGTGTISLPTALFPAFVGAKTVRLSSNGEVGLASFTALGTQTLTSNLPGGGAGSLVTITGTNFDPAASITIQGFTGSGQTSTATSDPAITVTSNAAGGFTASYSVSDVTTTSINAYRVSRMPAPIGDASMPFAIPGNVAFGFSGDSCTAKVGGAATGDCELLETVLLEVTAGDLKMSKVPGDVVMSGVTLNGTAQTSTGSLQDVTVMDYRGGTLGWDLVGTFSGLTGPAAITPDKLSWTPSCAAAANNDDTVIVGGAAAFTNATTALPLCSVDAGLGADGVSGGDTAADAGLELDLLANQAAGNYTGTLTLTLS